MRRTRGHGARRLAVAAALVALATVVAACSGTSSKVGTGTPKVTGKPEKGGVVTIAEVAASPNFIFPYAPSTNSNGYNVNLTEGLWPFLVYAGDGSKSVVNPQESAFSSLTYSHNDSVVTIVLKPWKWSDGAPVTSRDFTFVYNLLKYNYLNWIDYTQGLFPTDVTKVLTPNSHTVVLDLNRSYNPAFYTDDVLSEIQLIPQHAWDKTSLTGKIGNYDETKAGSKAVYAFLQKEGGLMSGFATNPLWKVVDGPWTLSTFNSNGYYVDSPNKNYSGVDKPIVSKVEYTPFTTDTAEMNTLRSGTSIDLGNLPLNDVSQVGALEAEGYTVANLPVAGVAEIVASADRIAGLDDIGRQVACGQRVAAERGQRREMGAGRMAAKVNAAGIAAVTGDVAVNPSNGVGAIVELRRKLRRRRMTVRRRHEDRGCGQDRGRHEGHPFLVPCVPASAVKKAEHR